MSASSKIRIGSRASKLAMIQVAEVQDLLSKICPLRQIEIVPITTSGDKILDRNLAEIGGKGLFIKELEEALINDEIDIAIHSAKDLVPIINPQTEIAAFTKRHDPHDCLVSSRYSSILQLPRGAIIGTSSSRRKAMLLKLRPDLEIVNFRGNVNTRLAKVEQGVVDGAILAVCGLKRLKQQQMITEIIDQNLMLPSGGQGALAVQIRKKDVEIAEIINQINDEETKICIKAERAFLRELGASCSTPVGAYAVKTDKSLTLKTIILDYDGSQNFTYQTTGDFNLESAIQIGIAAAKATKDKAQNLLAKICNS